MGSCRDDLTWMHVIVRVGLNVVTHPIEYAKILIQIGHEPLEPYKSRTIFGRETMFYPNVFKYIAYIKHKDGFYGCYRGLSPKLVGNIVSGLTFQKVTEQMKFPEFDNEDVKPDEDLTKQQLTQKFAQNTVRESFGRVAAITASQPFHVIAIRTMAEFVGEDGKYLNIVTSIKIIYEEEGIRGFFSGLIPRIICDLGALWLANTVIHLINNYIAEDKDIKSYISASVRFIAAAVMYPMQVVGNCMAITGSNLVAATPPRMPMYIGWYDCYQHLRQIKGLKRGSSLLWRAYYRPSLGLNSKTPKQNDKYCLHMLQFLRIRPHLRQSLKDNYQNNFFKEKKRIVTGDTLATDDVAYAHCALPSLLGIELIDDETYIQRIKNAALGYTVRTSMVPNLWIAV